MCDRVYHYSWVCIHYLNFSTQYPTSQKGEEFQSESRHIEDKTAEAGTGGGGGGGCGC